MKADVQESYRKAARHRSSGWLDDAAPLLSSAALTLLGILVAIVLADRLEIEPRQRTMLVFFAGILVLPVSTVTLQYWLDRRWPRAGRLFEALNVWCAVAALVSLAVVAVAAWAANNGVDFWYKAGLQAAKIAVSAYAALAVLLIAICGSDKVLDRASSIVVRASPRAIQSVALVFVFAAATIVLFKIQPGYGHFNPIFGFLFRTVPGGFPDRSSLLLGASTAAFLVAVGACLLMLERRLAAAHPAQLRAAQRAALVCALVASAVLNFDFSLAGDPFHYMTVMGPALHLLHGGTLMVDTFSQYGPGPVLVTYLAFQLGPPSFAVANIAIQLCNLLFYALFITALWQSTRTRMSAAWFGLVFILFWLSAWGGGQGNVNTAPSVLGGRYLPILFMAVGIGARGARHSALIFLAAFLSGLWSIEAFVGAFALYSGSLALRNLRDRTYARLAKDLAIAAAAMMSGPAALSVGTLLAAGSWPAFDVYLGFLSSYNPIGQFWSVPFDATFWGWIPILGGVAIAVAGCWLLVLDNKRSALHATSDTWLRHALPAAILTAITGSYFAARSVDFTVAIALLPFALLFIPAALWLAGRALDGDRAAGILTALTTVAVLWASIFSCLYMFRIDSPYSLLPGECRYHDRCSPAALYTALREKVDRELALRSTDNPWSLDDYDRAIVADAKRLIERYAATSPKVTVLLGEGANTWQMLSDIALMYVSKWHTSPRSFTFSDELVPAIYARILATDVTFATGDLVVRRRDEASLGSLEKAILERLRARGSLCELRGSTPEVIAYRFEKTGDPQSPEACHEHQIDGEAAERSTAPLQDIGSFIDALRTAVHALPDGPLDYPTLERAGVAVPPNLIAGRRLVSFSGPMSLQKRQSLLTIDLYWFPKTTCQQLLPAISQLAGVARMAITATSADEQDAPISQDRAKLLCAAERRFLRIIAAL
ncbi:hypothetical protein AB7008_34165 [Bradyrhizobium sp. 521_C7_N1_3]|uniref:hypothetical protein n=1 Tax=Bradyrhizobium sp. 521_C7_N1_3 TaxID=3240368 RepID=UPI003F8CB650